MSVFERSTNYNFNLWRFTSRVAILDGTREHILRGNWNILNGCLQKDSLVKYKLEREFIRKEVNYKGN